MKRFLIGFAFCFLQLAAFSFCSGDEPMPAHFTEWKAETIVDKSEIDRTGLDGSNQRKSAMTFSTACG